MTDVVYGVVLLTHSWLRWAVLLLGVGVLAQLVAARRGGEPPAITPMHVLFLRALDTQVALGLALYVLLSPLTRSAFGDFGAALSNSVLRFFSIEHVVGMLIAVSAAHFGYERLKRGARGALAAQVAWLIAVVVSIPWPVLPYGRPLARLFF